MKSYFQRTFLSAPLLAGLIAAGALTACIDSAAPTGNELAMAAAGGTAPVITQQPRTQFAVRVGDRFAVGVTATGTATLKYQWQKCDWNTVPGCVNIANANGPTFSRISHSGDSVNLFRCVVSNSWGSAKSNMVWYFPAPIVMQAENAILTGASVGSAGTGWTGTGYAFFPSINGGNIVFKPTLNNAGTYTIRIRYACDFPTSLKFEVNGVVVKSSLSLPTTFGMDQYDIHVSFDTPFKVGVNTIKATTLGWGGPRIDEISVM